MLSDCFLCVATGQKQKNKKTTLEPSSCLYTIKSAVSRIPGANEDLPLFKKTLFSPGYANAESQVTKKKRKCED